MSSTSPDGSVALDWSSFPFTGELTARPAEAVTMGDRPRPGEEAHDCLSCAAPDDAYVWVGERWRVRTTARPTGLPLILVLETRSHLDLGDLPNLLSAELGVMTVRLERAVRSLDGVSRVQVSLWPDLCGHLGLWFLARPAGKLQAAGPFLPLWDHTLPAVDEASWRQDVALVAEWLAHFDGRAIADPPHIAWQAKATVPLTAAPPALTAESVTVSVDAPSAAEPAMVAEELVDVSHVEPVGTASVGRMIPAQTRWLLETDEPPSAALGQREPSTP